MARAHVEPQVVVRGEGVNVARIAADDQAEVGVLEARRRFGGLDIPATLAGALAGVGTGALIAAFASGAGRWGFDTIGGEDRLTTYGRVGALVALMVAFVVGGWVAGRMARYDGGRNGLIAGVWFVLALLAGSMLYPHLGVGELFSGEAVTPGEIAAALGAAASLFLAAWAGGRAGSHYHDEADALIASTQRGGVARLNRRVTR